MKENDKIAFATSTRLIADLLGDFACCQHVFLGPLASAYGRKPDIEDQYWPHLKNRSLLTGATVDNKISPDDFRIFGDRLAKRQIDMFERYEATPLETSTIVDVGCALGRISLPFSKRFGKAVGIDINRRMLDVGALYCQDARNIQFIENDRMIASFLIEDTKDPIPPKNVIMRKHSGGFGLCSGYAKTRTYQEHT